MHGFAKWLCSGQMPVFDAVRLICSSAETGLSVRLVL
jgi:hypothetical protein